MNQDAEQLQVLSVFHYVVAGLVALFACIPIIHLGLGLAMVTGYGDFAHEDRGLAVVGSFLVVVGAVFILLGWTFAVCLALAGRWLQQRRHYTFCLVVAAFSCTFMPFGTVLGVFTILVLMRPSVKTLFGIASPSLPAPTG
ncbi:MAG TPA: hypothetical protein VF173_32795 [Thermoanaerobaculia bacterium]|nr:hypothetical protein [Thermoanaerobaculia bacterium]